MFLTFRVIISFIFSSFPVFEVFPVFVAVLLGTKPVISRAVWEGLRDYNDVFPFNIVSQNSSPALLSTTWSRISSIFNYQRLRLCGTKVGNTFLLVFDSPVLKTFRPMLPKPFFVRRGTATQMCISENICNRGKLVVRVRDIGGLKIATYYKAESVRLSTNTVLSSPKDIFALV